MTVLVCVQPWTQATIRVCAAGVEYWRPDQERTTTLRQNAARWNPGESREVWVQLFKKVHGLSDDTRKWRNAFLATARGIGFGTSVLEPCVLVLRDSQQRYHGLLEMANSAIAGGGDEVWEQAISELKKRFTFGRWEEGQGKFGGREVVQAADGSMRVGQPVFLKNLDFVSLGNNEEGTIRRC